MLHSILLTHQFVMLTMPLRHHKPQRHAPSLPPRHCEPQRHAPSLPARHASHREPLLSCAGAQEGALSLWLTISGGQRGSAVTVARNFWGAERERVSVAHNVWGAERECVSVTRDVWGPLASCWCASWHCCHTCDSRKWDWSLPFFKRVFTVLTLGSKTTVKNGNGMETVNIVERSCNKTIMETLFWTLLYIFQHTKYIMYILPYHITAHHTCSLHHICANLIYVHHIALPIFLWDIGIWDSQWWIRFFKREFPLADSYV